MSNASYPEGIDCVWIASDKDGRIGAFISAGLGPIPEQIINNKYLRVEDIEEQILKLPCVAEARMLVSVERPDSYIALGMRGLFVFDWTDIHRTRAESTGLYEPVAIPMNPIGIHAIPRSLLHAETIVRLVDCVFSLLQGIDVQRLVNCRSIES